MPEQLYWHEDIKKYWHSSGVSAINFEKIPHILLVFHSWIYRSVASWVYQHRSKYRKVEIMKHARIDENQAILIKWVKIYTKWKEGCIEFIKYAECRLSENIYKIYWEFRSARIISLQEKNRSGNHLSDHHW